MIGKIRTARRIHEEDGLSAVLKTTRKYYRKRIFNFWPAGWLLVQLKWVTHGALVYPSDGLWVKYEPASGDKQYVPQLSHEHRWRPNYTDVLQKRYQKPGEIEVEEGDVVFDIGGLTGDFGRIHAPKAERVIIVEPNPVSAKCCRKNTRHLDNVTVVQRLAYNENKPMELQLGVDRSDDSALAPDDGGSGERIIVQAERIDSMAERLDINSIDFLKCDAEGAEPEVIEGIGTTPVGKLAISANYERQKPDEDAYEMCAALLEQRGYSILESDPDAEIEGILWAYQPDYR